jgi:periplasmic divalent cation tolerance protein
MAVNEDKYIVVSTTCDDQETAGTLAEKLLLSKLVACVQLESIDSHYWWGGEVQHQREIRISMKTVSANYNKIERLILKVHPYDVPEIVATELIGGSAAYFRWIDEVTKSL